jgi:large subunit ribosomal protein L30
MADMITVTLKRSMIGRTEKHRRVIDGLGLKKVNSSVTLRNTPEVLGMIRKVEHLVTVSE